MSSDESEDEFQSADEGTDNEETKLSTDILKFTKNSYPNLHPIESIKLPEPGSSDCPISAQDCEKYISEKQINEQIKNEKIDLSSTISVSEEDVNAQIIRSDHQLDKFDANDAYISVPVLDSDFPKHCSTTKSDVILIKDPCENERNSVSVEDDVLCASEQTLNIELVRKLDLEHKIENLAQTDENTDIHDLKENICLDSDKIAGNESESTVKPKRIKQSKIGLKKPRERLGERLGSKAIGSRKTNPLVGISSDTVQTSPPIVKQPNVASTYRQNASDDWNKDSSISEVSSVWDSFGNWGATLASAASTLTKEVSKGVGTVIENVESGMGIPDAKILAQEAVEIEKQMKKRELSEAVAHESFNTEQVPNAETVEVCNSESSFGFGFGGFSSLVSGVSGALETASNKMLLGGLDTLEKIGRKTMDVIQDGDPGLRRKRAFLNSRSNNLSTVLKEARQRAIVEEENRKHESNVDELRKDFRQISMTQIWECTEGSAHTEALSLVANICQSKTSSVIRDLPAIGINRLFPMINKIKACSELPEEKEVVDITKELAKITRDVELPLQFNKILIGWPSLEASLSRLSIQIQGFGSDECHLNDIERDLFEEVAQLVANAVAIIHKAAELSLVTQVLDFVTMAQQFQQFCGCLSSGLEQLADNICESITRSLPSTEAYVSSSVTNIYVQMAEANSFLETSLQHLTTVLIQGQAKQIASEL